MVNKQPVSVGILRPQLAAFEAQSDTDAYVMNLSQSIYKENMDTLMDEVRQLLDEAADYAERKIEVTEYQLFHLPDTQRIIGPKRARRAKNNDVLMGLDLNAREFNFIHKGLDTRALQRGICVFTSERFREDMQTLLATKRTPLLPKNNTESFRKLPRLFSLYVSPNEEESAHAFTGNRKILEMALKFPDIPPQQTERVQFTDIIAFGNDQRESSPAFREYFTGKTAREEAKENR